MDTLRLLIDGDILTYKVCWAVQTVVHWDDGILTTATNVEELKSQADFMIQEWQEKLGEGKEFTTVICFSDRANNFRRKIFPDYKLNRKGSQKPLGYNHLETYLKEQYATKTQPMLEADDVLGILATDGEFDRNIIISIDPEYENGGGYFMLGAVHFKSPYIPFLLSWPDNDDAIKYLTKALNIGEATPNQKVYLAQAMYKDGQKSRAIDMLKEVANMQPSAEEIVRDWEQIELAEQLLSEYR